MLGLPYRNGYILALRKEDIIQILPYLTYSRYVFTKLHPLEGEAAEMSLSSIRLLHSRLRGLVGWDVSRGTEKRNNNTLHILSRFEVDIVHFCYVLLSDQMLTTISQGIPLEQIIPAFQTLDRRLPNRGETEHGLLLVKTLFNMIQTREPVEMGVYLPHIVATYLKTYDWASAVPNFFSPIIDLSAWTARVDMLVSNISIARRRSKDFLRKTLTIRGKV